MFIVMAFMIYEKICGYVAVTYPTCTLIWSILAYLPTILSLIDLLGIR